MGRYTNDKYGIKINIPEHNESVSLYERYTKEQIENFKQQIKQNRNEGLTSIESAEKIGIPYKDFVSLFNSSFCTRR